MIWSYYAYLLRKWSPYAQKCPPPLKKNTLVGPIVRRKNQNILRNIQKYQENLKEKSIPIISVEGKGSSEWVLLDLGDIVVNIMSKSARELYDLESLWGAEMSPSISSDEV